MASQSVGIETPGIAALADLLAGRRVVVLTGAGCSTESGIPDYRGPQTLGRSSRPIQYREFVGGAEARARYWSRSVVGWPRVTGALPNPAHRALARLEEGGVVAGIITQNVDGLHHAAGSRRVVELHGTLAHVRCLECGARCARATFQTRLLELNGRWVTRRGQPAAAGKAALPPDPEAQLAADRETPLPPDREAQLAPDGDAAIPLHATESFRVPGCGECGGIVKPDVVFFGETVPKPRVSEAWRLYECADVLLVAGSSLTVYSGRRFSDRARAEGRRIAILNIGPTRADDAAAVKVEGRLGRILPELAQVLLGA